MIRDVYLVAEREVAQKLRDRAFLLFTAFLVLLPVAGGMLGAFAGGGGGGGEQTEYSVGLVGQDRDRLGALVEEQAVVFGLKVDVEGLPNARAATRTVGEEKLDAAIVDGERLLTIGTPSTELQALLQSSAQRLRASESLQRLDAPPREVESVLGPSQSTGPLAVEQVAAGGGEHGSNWIAVSVGPILLFITVMTYGYWIANGVVEEKSSRVVEVVLATLRPSRLLMGKILGIGLLGLGQLALLAVVAWGVAFGADTELPPGALGVAASVLVWFVLGFAFYGCLFAVAGALVSKQEDIQYTQLPIMALLFVGYGAAFYGVDNPGAVVVKVLSLLPPFAPMLMPMRYTSGEAGALEVVTVALVMALATIGLVILASRLYSGAVLRFGARVPLLEAWRSSR